jgi:hypothetical protein
MSTNERPKAHVDKPDCDDLETGIHALAGVFEALNWRKYAATTFSSRSLAYQTRARWSIK